MHERAMNLTRIRELLPQFESEFLRAKSGRDHMAWFPAGRAAGRANLEEAVRKRAACEDITDFTLAKLLPHADTRRNRERGAWISVAPVVTKEIRTWFEGAGWAEPGDWPRIAELLFKFITTVTGDPERLEAECQAFRDSPYSRGFQSGFLSPILNAVRPDVFCLVNSKTKKTFRALTGVSCYTSLVEYPASNGLIQRVVHELQSDLPAVSQESVFPADVLDAFCYWYVSVHSKGLPEIDDGNDNDDAGEPATLMRKFYREDGVRLDMCELLASRIEWAHHQGPGCWETTVRKRRIRLNVGRIAALDLARDGLRITVVPEDVPGNVRDRLQADERWGTEFATEPPTRLCELTPVLYRDLAPTLDPSSREAIRLAAQTGLQSPFARYHNNELIDYLEAQVGRTLPRPVYDERKPQRREDGALAKTQMEPAKSFDARQTLFHRVELSVMFLVNRIELGDIGLPELQRPFVWDRAKVRDLFDSMYRGFPVGFLLLWANSQMQQGKQIGLDRKQLRVPSDLVVDGQQRLTSLYAVMKGAPVLDSDFRSVKIEIAFRPRDGRFEVADAAVRRDPEFIPNISALWTNRGGEFRFVNDFLQTLKQSKELRPEDENIISDNISRLQNLVNFQLNALVVHADVAEDEVADIFVRINNQGTRLDQADFILTLLSVFWPEGRKELEDFAKAAKVPAAPGAGPSPFNYLIQPGADQMLRTSVALGFHRGRMKAVYQILRGRHSDTGEFVPEIREAQFERLRAAQPSVLDLNNWHAYLQCLRSAGFIGPDTIASEAAVVFTYAIYLLGKLQAKLKDPLLSRTIARWFTAVTLTARYSGSAETTMDADLSDLREITTPEAFVDVLNRKIATELTGDFWHVRLPASLQTSAALSPGWAGFRAAQVVLSAPVLFSDKKVRDLLDPAMRPPTKSLEQHHLYPRAWLRRQGITSPKRINQVANLALIEWPQNRDLSDLPPSDYVPRLRPQFNAAAWERMHHLQALPLGWESMEYEHFLEERRRRMAAVIRQAFEALNHGEDGSGLTMAEGTADERRVWTIVQELEQRLRSAVRAKYVSEWGPAADRQIAAVLGADAMRVIDKNREKHAAAYVGGGVVDEELLDYCYLGQLGQLMTANQAWKLFQSAFRDKRELEDLVKAVVPVRNDLAHFRRVPEKELDRCRIAADDLLKAVGRLG